MKNCLVETFTLFLRDRCNMFRCLTGDGNNYWWHRTFRTLWNKFNKIIPQGHWYRRQWDSHLVKDIWEWSVCRDLRTMVTDIDDKFKKTILINIVNCWVHVEACVVEFTHMINEIFWNSNRSTKTLMMKMHTLKNLKTVCTQWF